MQPPDQPTPPPSSRDLRQELAEGLLYAHSRLYANTGKTLGGSFLYTLVERSSSASKARESCSRTPNTTNMSDI